MPAGERRELCGIHSICPLSSFQCPNASPLPDRERVEKEAETNNNNKVFCDNDHSAAPQRQSAIEEVHRATEVGIQQTSDTYMHTLYNVHRFSKAKF